MEFLALTLPTIALVGASVTVAHFGFVKSNLREIAFETAALALEPDLTDDEIQDEVRLRVVQRVGDVFPNFSIQKTAQESQVSLGIEPQLAWGLIPLVTPELEVTGYARRQTL